MELKNNINYFSYSAIGPRKVNEDFYKIEVWQNQFIISIADGVGGRPCGSDASKFSVESFHREVKKNENSLIKVLEKIHNDFTKYFIEHPSCKGMATTFTGCVINNNILDGVHVGDSRLCILRRNGIKELTFEHSEAAHLYRNKLISKEQYFIYPRKNIIQSALGMNEEFLKQSFNFNLLKGDRIILSTDGFHNLISKLELRNLSLRFKLLKDLHEFLKKLLSERSLNDNTTFILIEIS